MSILVLLVMLLWAGCFISGIVFFFVVLRQRLKEKEIEKIKHKDYDKY